MAVGCASCALYKRERKRFSKSVGVFKLLSQTEGVEKLKGAFWKRTALLCLFGSVASLAGSFFHPTIAPLGLSLTALTSPVVSRLWLLAEMREKERKLRDALTSFPPLVEQ